MDVDLEFITDLQPGGTPMNARSSLLGMLAVFTLSCAFVSPAEAGPSATRVVTSSTLTPRINEPVWRDYRDDLGNVMRVTVTPPTGKSVDMGVLDFADVQIVAADRTDEGAAPRNLPPTPPSGVKTPRPTTDRVIDFSGYTVTMDLVTAASCSVAGYYTSSTVSLSASSWYTMQTASGAEYITVTAYPTSGDVDVYTYSGTTQCSSSTRDAGYIDVAGCYSSSCSNSGTFYAKIKNYMTGSTSKFVATSNAFWVNF